MSSESRALHFTSADRASLQLEGRWVTPPGPGPFPAAAVAHPHPLHGGSMHTPLIRQITQTLVTHGWGALRFNFRGVGSSEGDYEEGRGETHDLIGALDWLSAQSQVDTRRLAVVGYSFGAWIAGRAAARDQRIRAYVAVALPIALSVALELDDFNRPKCFITGAEDTISPPEPLRHYVDALPQPKRLHVIPHAAHFLLGQEQTVADLVAEFLTSLTAQTSADDE